MSTPKNNATMVLAVRVSPALMHTLRELSYAQRRSLSKQVTIVLEEGLKALGVELPGIREKRVYTPGRR